MSHTTGSPTLTRLRSLFSRHRSTTTERLGLPELRTVAHVDLSRYLGTWYELASYPQSFQEGCTGTTAHYSARDDGLIEVVNRCAQDTLDGKLQETTGRARVVDTATNAKLEVSFFPLVWNPYWIIELASDYSHAVVSHPSRDYLWVLSRAPRMETSTYDRILERIVAHGYPLDRLELTAQRVH